VPELAAKVAAGRLGWRLEDIAFDIVLPAMIDAAQPACLIAAEKKLSAPVRAVLAKQADPAIGIAKCDKILAQ